MPASDDRSILQVVPDKDGQVKAIAINEILRQIQESIAALEGRLGEIALRDDLRLPGALTMAARSAAPGLSATGEGRIYFDGTLAKFRASQSGGAMIDLITTLPPATGLGQFQLAFATATLTKNSDTTLADVPGLAFTVAANENWAFLFTLHGIATTTANFKVTLTGPAAPTALRFGVIHAVPIAGSTSQTAFGATIQKASSFGAIDQTFSVGGLLRNGANAGTVQFQFAQNTSEATDSKIYIESSVFALRASS